MQPQQIEGQRAQTILVVDSDESTRRILDLSLRHAGFAVRVASNAEEGGKRLADRPDLVIVAADDPEGLDFLPPREAGRRDGAGGGADARRRASRASAAGWRRAPTISSRARSTCRRWSRVRARCCSGAIASGSSNRRTTTSASSARSRTCRSSICCARSPPTRSRASRWSWAARARAASSTSARDASSTPRSDACRAATRLPPVLLVVGQPRRRVEEHPAQGHDRDGAARSPDGGAATRGRVAAAARGRAAARHDLRGRLPAARRAARRHPRRGEPHPASVRRRADVPAGDRRLRSARTSTRSRRSASSIASGSSTTSAFPSTRTRRSSADMEGWLSDAAGPFRSPARHERDLFGAGPDPGVGVHGRRTAPIDPLGEGAREALDDDMRVRFTDRLQAEGARTAATAAMRRRAADGRHDAAAPPRAATGIPELPLEALIDSAPAGNGARPTTLPGMGAAKRTRVARGRAIAVAETLPRRRGRRCPSDRVAARRRCRRARRRRRRRAGVSPLERPYGWHRARRASRGARRARSTCRSWPPSRQSQVRRAARARARGLGQGVRAQVDGDAAGQRARARRAAAAHGGASGRSRARGRVTALVRREADRRREQDHQGRRRPRRRVLEGRCRGRAGRLVARAQRAGVVAGWPSWSSRARSPRSGSAQQAVVRRRSRAEGAGDGVGPRRAAAGSRSSRRWRHARRLDARQPGRADRHARRRGAQAGRAARRVARGARRAHRRSAHGARARRARRGRCCRSAAWRSSRSA